MSAALMVMGHVAQSIVGTRRVTSFGAAKAVDPASASAASRAERVGKEKLRFIGVSQSSIKTRREPCRGERDRGQHRDHPEPAPPEGTERAAGPAVADGA